MADGNQSGTFTGYRAVYKDENDKWKNIEYRQEYGRHVTVLGVPYPMWNGGILQQMWLLGFNQANAIAYLFAADKAAVGKEVEVKVEAYKVNYTIDYSKLEEDECKQ